MQCRHHCLLEQEANADEDNYNDHGDRCHTSAKATTTSGNAYSTTGSSTGKMAPTRTTTVAMETATQSSVNTTTTSGRSSFNK